MTEATQEHSNNNSPSNRHSTQQTGLKHTPNKPNDKHDIHCNKIAMASLTAIQHKEMLAQSSSTAHHTHQTNHSRALGSPRQKTTKYAL